MDFVDTLQQGYWPFAVKMKIFVNARFLTQPVSGVQRYAIECSRQIKKLHGDVTFLAPKDILHADIAKELNVTVIGSRKGHLWEQIDLPFYLTKRKSPPLLNLANTGPMWYGNSFVTIHDLAFYHHPEWNSKKFSMWYNIMVPRIAISSRHVFTVSETIKGELIKYYRLPAGKISVTYNGLSQKMLDRGMAGQAGKEKIILSVGTFNIRKNHPNLISGYLNSELNNEYRLVLIGDKNKVFKEGGIDESSLKDNIEIYATLKEDELIDMYRKAEIVASLSLYEGFGIPLLEGLYNGCKILCSDIPVYREIYGDCATFCDATNIDAIAAGLRAVVGKEPASPQKVEELMERYSYRRSAEKILAAMAAG